MSAPAALHEPQKVAQASCLFGADRLEACPTLQPAARFMAPTHVRFLEVSTLHETYNLLDKFVLHMQHEFVQVGSWSRCAILESWRLSTNLVAADVRRLRSISDFGFQISDLEKRASSRRLLQFSGSMREILGESSPSPGSRRAFKLWRFCPTRNRQIIRVGIIRLPRRPGCWILSSVETPSTTGWSRRSAENS